MIYQARRAFASMAFLLLVAQMIVAVGGLLANVLSARGLGPEGRGELALYLQLTYVVGAVVAMGRDKSFPAIAGESFGTSADTNDYARLLRGPLVAAVAVCLAAAWFVRPEQGPILLVLSAALWAVVVGNLAVSGTRAVSIVSGSAVGYVVTMAVSQAVLLVAFLVLSVTRVRDPLIWFWVYGVALLVPFLVLGLVRGLGGRPVGRRSSHLDRVKRFGVGLVPSTIAEILTTRIDRLLIPAFAGYSALGYYVVVATFTELILWPVRHYVDSKVPHWAKDVRDGKPVKSKGALAVVSVISVGLGVTVGAIIWLLIPLLFGADFTASRDLILPLVLASGVYGLSRLATGLATAERKSRAVNVINGFGLVASLALYFWLIPPYGAPGAAWASFGGYLAATLAGCVYMLLRSTRSRYGLRKE